MREIKTKVKEKDRFLGLITCLNSSEYDDHEIGHHTIKSPLLLKVELTYILCKFHEEEERVKGSFVIKFYYLKKMGYELKVPLERGKNY